MLGTVLVGPCVRVELASEEDFLSLLEEIPRNDLLVVVELLLDVICDATGNILTDMELLKKIRQWRYDKAKEKNMRAYWIFNNATLVDLATRQPMTREELLSISGIGEKKIELYGDEILLIIIQHCNTDQPANNHYWNSDWPEFE